MSLAMPSDGMFSPEKGPFIITRAKSTTPWSMQKYHYHDKIELYYLFSGTRCYFIEDKSYYIRAGELVTVAPYDIHATAAVGRGEYDRMLISFDRSYLADVSERAFGDVFAFLRDGSRAVELSIRERCEVEALLEAMLRESETPAPDSDAFIRSALLRLVLILGRKSAKREESDPCVPERTLLVSRVTAAVNSRFAQRLSLTALAEEFFVSPSYLSRSFSRTTGMPLAEYVNAVRIKEAQRLLLTTERSVADIAESVGYASTTHFDRMFRRRTHTTPLDFRMKRGM